jgi:hypothetical protein
MALKINNVWKKWGVRLWSPFKSTYTTSCRKRTFEQAVELGYQEVAKLREEIAPHPHRFTFKPDEVPNVDVGFVTVDVVMELKGSVWIDRGLRFTQTSPAGLRCAYHTSRGADTFASAARIKRGGEAYVSLDPYLYDMGTKSQSHYLRLAEALSQAEEYLKEHSVFWNAFRHTA